jgi:hypothetical protein
LYLVLMVAMLFTSLPALVSCNKDKDDDNSTYSYSESEQTTLVTGFALQADADVLASLDSVHFTIDYNNGLIYNADSLPVGTDISALKVTVDFLNTVSSAVFSITGATVQADTTITYTSQMSKSLDFTGNTKLTVTSADESQVKDYEVKVLVHKMNPDSLVIPQSWRRDLPGYASNLQGHKAVKQGDVYRIMTYDGSVCTMLWANSPNQPIWTPQTVDVPFVPQVKSLCATDDALYVLGADGTLYTSADGGEWTSCGVVWHTLLGTYEDRVLGVAGSDGYYYHDEYPRSADFTATPIEAGFPVSHSSDMIQTDNTWTISQQAMIVGGYDANGQLLRDVWGFDGHHWGKINNIHTRTLPALADATLFPYYTYKALSGVRRYALQETWFVMGGRLADGTLNGKVYLSNTQGITWSQADSTMAMPSEMPKFYGAQAFVNEETLSASGPSYAPGRVSSAVTTWECPFLYLMGGYNDQGDLLPYTWRGVYNRMTNYPVY